ncbi:MAG: hypothetical protein OXC57_12575 [Rhodobacteraceae bacterium]|nr:hypothetical protein [Paracoccaceae bacterium]
MAPPSPDRERSILYRFEMLTYVKTALVFPTAEMVPKLISVISPVPAQAGWPTSPGAVMVCAQTGPANATTSRAAIRLKVGGGYSTVVS